MRTNFYELLAKKNFSITEEYSTLLHLFSTEEAIYSNPFWETTAEHIDKQYFRELPFRGSYTSLNQIMSAFGFSRISSNIDHLLTFCEFLIAVLPEQKATRNLYFRKQRNTILGNINHILERTNHELMVDPNGNTIIVEKNKAATLAAQLVDDEVIAFELIEYNHFALKGDLEGKKKLLFSIAAHIEPILKSHALQKAGYKQLESDAGFLFNNFHIRHNNRSGAKAQVYITSISNADLEEWYDKAYEVALSVIIINDYITIGKDIANVKSKYTWKT